MGSLWELGVCRLILLAIIGWPISEQGRAHVARKLAVGFSFEHTQEFENTATLFRTIHCGVLRLRTSESRISVVVFFLFSADIVRKC